MAVSPLVAPGGTSNLQRPSNDVSRFATQTSSNATPADSPLAQGSGRDLADQLNEVEKNKYIKGV